MKSQNLKNNYNPKHASSIKCSNKRKTLIILLFSILAIILFVMSLTSKKIIISQNNAENLTMKAENTNGTTPVISAADSQSSDTELEVVNTEDTSWNATSARPFLYYSGSFGGAKRNTKMHVFAYEGDTICVGTNIYNSGFDITGTKQDNTSHNDEGSIDIVMYDLDGEPVGIDVTGEEGSPGYINDYATEQIAKHMTSPNGNMDKDGNKYVPYKYIVRETGVYTFEFRPYSGSGATNITADGNKQNGWNDPKNLETQGNIIAAWDITVFNENNEKEPGRTYTDSISIQTIGTVNEEYYILTDDSYIYDMKLAGIQPYTFSFFANNRGITNIANGNIIYKSVKDIRNSIQFLKFGIDYTAPSTDNTDVSKNFRIFFEEPNEDLKGQLYGDAVLPDPAKNVKYISGKEIYENTGGYFSFDVDEATTATLRIEFENEDDSESDYATVEISDAVKPYSTNCFYWDGKDGKGQTVKSGSKIKYSVITKAGEIHFPLIDVESIIAGGGVTFTRVNNIYTKNGEQVNTGDTIYDKTKNVIYYDDTAIYYGEQITATGLSEKDVTYETSKTVNGTKYTVENGIPFNLIHDANDNPIAAYRNILSTNSSEYKAYKNYGAKNNLRVGDHSSINNIIDYNSDYESQQALINYLDSAKNPVGVSATNSYITSSTAAPLKVTSEYTTGANYNSTTDYGIANYWTFITAKTVYAEEEYTIKPSQENTFNLVARVFYDENSDGLYDKQADGDHLLENVTLNLYKKYTEKNLSEDKTYVYKDNTGALIKIEKYDDAKGADIYELINTGVTPLQGTYCFTNIEYDKDNATDFLYQVIRPNSSLKVTSEKKQAKDGIKTQNTTITTSVDSNGKKTTKSVPSTYGHYTQYKYSTTAYGTEIQTFTIGGEKGIDLNKEEENKDNRTVTTIDVGYKYERNTTELDIKKVWNTEEKDIPDSVAIEVCYNTKTGPKVYKVEALSSIISWNHSYKYLETEIRRSRS